jgi:hypothetical protein
MESDEKTKVRLTVAISALICLCLPMVFAPITFADGYTEFGLTDDDFVRLSTGGFGDSANSYSWGIAYYKGDLYVGTNRHHLWSVWEGMSVMIGPSLGIDLDLDIDIVDDPPGEIGSEEWANAMRGEIWRYSCGTWEMVYQSQLWDWINPDPTNPLYPPTGKYPVAYGYRMMGTFEDQLFVCGIGTWWPSLPLSTVLVTDTGDLGTWNDITGILAGTNNVRGLVEFNCDLYVTASTPGASVSGAGLGVVYRYTPETPGLWTAVSEEGFGSDYNTEFPYLIEFNNHLYTSTLNYEMGFEVWKTDGTVGGDGKYIWTPVVTDGFGDTWNQWGMTMEVFNDHLYIGTAVGAGLVIKNNEIAGTRAFDVIRVDKDDNAELVVGAYIARDPPAGWPTSRTPLSKWPAGFGNPLNFYVWHMEVHDGVLYLGTFDGCGLLQFLPELIEGLFDEEMLASLGEELTGILNSPEIQAFLQENPEYAQYIQELLQTYDSGDASALIQLIVQYTGGADLWKTNDGIHWVPVTLNGFDNPNNYGVRRLLSVCDTILFVGTANPFTGLPRGGCEVLQATEQPFVVPEVPLGTLTVFTAAISAFTIYITMKRKPQKLSKK